MGIGSMVVPKKDRERVGRVLEIDDFDMVTVKIISTGDIVRYCIYELEEVF